MELIRKIRLGNTIPALVAGALFYGDEQLFGTHDAPVPPYIQVKELKMTSPRSMTSTNDCYFGTGIYVPTSQQLYVVAQITPYAWDGGIVIGVNVNMNYFWRFFTYIGWVVFDLYSSRNENKDGLMSLSNTYDIEFGLDTSGGVHGQIKDINASTYTNLWGSKTFGNYDYSPNNELKIWLCSTGMRAIKIYDNYAKENLLFDGIAVLDSIGTPCLYDKVSGQFLYLNYTGSDYGTLTYISL